MLLSVCLIVKNEEHRLKKTLASIKPVADEIVVADTGSTDNTVQLAQELGARVCHFKWCDDFSAARNFCFSQAKGDWIFWLDADEELLPQSVDELRNCLVRKDVFAFLILRQDLAELDRPDLYTEMWLPRLFRNHKDARLLGRHHEQFRPSIAEIAAANGQIVETSQIRIRHYGFAGPKRAEKFHRDRKLLELELQERPNQIYYQIELYRTLLLLGDTAWKDVLAQAASNLLPHINDTQPPTPHVALLLETLLQLPAGELPKGFSKPQLYELAQRWFPISAPLIWILAKEDYLQGLFEQAERRLRWLIKMGKEHSYDRMVGFDPAILGDEARLNLAACLVRQAKLDEAIQILSALTKSQKYGQAAEQNLRAITQIRRGTSGTGRRRKKI